MNKEYVSLVLPVHNEEGNLDELYRRSKKVLERLGKHEIIFINDGSTDNSLKKIKELRKEDQTVKIIDFSRNFGHQVAITAGLDYSSGDVVVIMDSDLQDIPELIPKMVEKWKNGYDIVYAKRRTRNDSAFKKTTAFLFYRLLSIIADIDIPSDVGDFRLLDRKVVAEMKKLRENARFIRGLVSWTGFRRTAVFFERKRRKHGTTNYSLKKMIRFSLEGITSFSDFPLKLGYYLSLILLITGLLVIILTLTSGKNASSGLFYYFITALILLLAGINSFLIGVQGEYIGRIHREVKKRPLYIVKKEIGFKK